MVHRKLLAGVFIAVTVLGLSSLTIAQSKGGSHQLTIDDLIEIKHPSDPIWSPDGRRIAFVWERAGIRNLYVVNVDGISKPVALTSFTTDGVSRAFWDAHGEGLYFPREGALWQVSVTGGQPRPVWTTAVPETQFALSPDGTRVAFVRSSKDEAGSGSSELVVRVMANGNEVRLMHDPSSIEHPVWSPNGARLAFTTGNKIIHHDESPAYSGDKIIFRANEYQPGQLFVIPAAGGPPVPIGAPGDYDGLAWVDSSHISFDRQSDNSRTRTIYLADINTGTARAIHEDKEEQFWSLPDWEANARPQPSPDGKWLAFLTDLDGWDHLYVAPTEGGTAIQISKGHFEAWRPTWSHDSTRIAFDANEPDHPGDRRVGIAQIGKDPAHSTITYVTEGPGTNIEPRWSPDDTRLVYQHTDPHNSADLFVAEASSGAKEVRLSDSMPAGVDHSAFIEPQLVHYPGPDGQQVPAWLFVPKNLDRSKKHPAILWVHGDGINQNYHGWHVQRNYAVYYSFHQYLLQQGYVVLAPDYRGSIGYGRDWRNGVYMDVGGNDAKDAWMGANYLKTLPYVDADRIGIWGLSYGGFFTLIAMTDQPTLFRAGVDVAGVVDYRMYYTDPYHGDWTVSRIGTPQHYPKVYDLASPISRIDQVARPLLVLHGTADVNVPFLESVWLMDEALKKDKGGLLQLMIYPGEFHYFTREHVLRDAWSRVDHFFAAQLRATSDSQ
jgi:dipeptidyl aminopeptidase/acylaminoacyl peptidase